MAQDLFTQAQQDQIIKAIGQAETNTSGEIKVHIEKECPVADVLERAKEVFLLLKMHQTASQNGVLFYLSVEDHKFAILGDKGIDAVVPTNFWDTTKNAMREVLKKGQITEGLCAGIQMAGDQLKAHFPYQQNDTNELSDEISFGS